MLTGLKIKTSMLENEYNEYLKIVNQHLGIEVCIYIICLICI